MSKDLAIKAALAVWRGADALRAPKRASRKRMDLIARLQNDDFVKAANNAARMVPGTHPVFGQDAQSGLFTCRDGEVLHHFAHRQRLSYYISGLAARGRKLAGEYLLDQVALSDGDSIVDVGANVGDLGLALQARKVTANVTAFEPSPREFLAMQRNHAANPAILGSGDVHNAAAWCDEAAAMEFYVKSETADSSLMPIEDYDDIIKVPTVRLDRILERRPYTLLKLEAEGAEPEILQGAEGVLDCFRFIAADVGFERGLRQESTLPQVVNHLTARGFEVRGVGRKRLVVLFERTGEKP